ncbi:hypothetical protein SK128_000533 [Halocaridina rubra]|uniref:HAT C-terminal dimerisation domain-containing protein n=1 Tax=Halocaridina rubra TaxID=373956 RepID=A0AAN9A3H3_HALRR
MKDDIEQQYRKILHLSWVEEPVFNGEIPKDAVSFWSGVLQYKNAAGNRPFEDLGEYAMACLTTSTSSAVVERILSSVTCVKTTLRNWLSSTMLDALTLICVHLQLKGKCCRDFEVTPHMLDLFKSANMYEKEGPDGENEPDIVAFMNTD